jgi:arylsulfatase A-like enzyme
MKVVTLLIDTLCYDFMGFNFNNERIKTPNMERLAANSIIDKAYLGSYPCVPARSVDRRV